METFEGIDTAARLTAEQARILRAQGVSFAARYLVPEKCAKALTAREAAALRGCGLALMLCWETTAKRMLGGASAGAADGAAARELAAALGVPAGTLVYFAADWDVQEDELDAALAYFRAARSAVQPYGAGVYGGARVMRAMCSETAWLWQSVAWSDGFLPITQVRQYQWQGSPDAKALAAKVGAAVDLDCAVSLDGMWLAEGTPHQSPAATASHQGEADEKENEPMKNWKEFLRAAGVRAARTLAQTALATIGTGAVLSDVNWAAVASASLLAAVLSVLTSIATGLPEVDGRE